MVEIGLGEPDFDEALVDYVRRSCATTERASREEARWEVQIARQRDGEVNVSVTARFRDGLSQRGQGCDADARLAVRNAFALLEQRMTAVA